MAAASLSRSAGILYRVILAVQLGGVGMEKLAGAGLEGGASPNSNTTQPIVVETSCILLLLLLPYLPVRLLTLQHYS